MICAIARFVERIAVQLGLQVHNTTKALFFFVYHSALIWSQFLLYIELNHQLNLAARTIPTFSHCLSVELVIACIGISYLTLSCGDQFQWK